MKFYQDITLIDEDHTVWSKLYQRLHAVLADLKNTEGSQPVGVCFPQYHAEMVDDDIVGTLGGKLRIFAPDESILQKIALAKRLAFLNDDIHISSIKPVPESVKGHVVVSRYRYKSLERKTNSRAAFKRVSYDEAFEYVAKYTRKALNYPFVSLKSSSNGNYYPLSIKQEMTDTPKDGQFNNYGITSSEQLVTVPVW